MHKNLFLCRVVLIIFLNFRHRWKTLAGHPPSSRLLR